MKKQIVTAVAIILAAWSVNVCAGEMSLEAYLSGFDYEARKDMKIDSEALVKGLTEGNIQLVDIRFKEEYEA